MLHWQPTNCFTRRIGPVANRNSGARLRSIRTAPLPTINSSWLYRSRAGTTRRSRKPGAPLNSIRCGPKSSWDDPQHCQIKPDWNAAVCKGDFGRLQIGAAGAGGFGGRTTILAGTEIRAESEAPSLTISLRELDSGSSVILELQRNHGYGTNQHGGTLRSATSTSYYKGEGAIWVKLVSNGGGARPGRGGGVGGSIQVSPVG